MNIYQHDNIDKNITQREREAALNSRGKGINKRMSEERRAAKHRRHAENFEARREASRG